MKQKFIFLLTLLFKSAKGFLPLPLAISLSIQASPIPAAYEKLELKATGASLEVQRLQADVDLKKASVFSSWSKWIPRADLELSQGKSKDYTLPNMGLSGAAFPPVQEKDQSRWNLQLQMPLYDRGNHLLLQKSYAQQKFARLQLENHLSFFKIQMRALFGRYLLKTYQEAVINNSLIGAQSNIKENQLSFTNGKKTKIDVLRAQANYAAFSAKLVMVEQEKSVALNDFLEFSGLDPLETQRDLQREDGSAWLTSEEKIAQTIEEFTNLEKSFRLYQQTLGSDTSALSGPLHEQLLQQKELAHVEARSFTRFEWPQLVLQGQLNKQGEHWSDVSSTHDSTRVVALVLKLPLFSGGSLFSTSKEEQLAKAQAYLQWNKDKLNLHNNLMDEQKKITAQQKSLESLKIHLEQQKEIYRLMQLSYSLGKSSIFDYYKAQDEYLDAKLQYAQLKLDLSSSIEDYAWKMGVRFL